MIHIFGLKVARDPVLPFLLQGLFPVCVVRSLGHVLQILIMTTQFVQCDVHLLYDIGVTVTSSILMCGGLCYLSNHD